MSVRCFSVFFLFVLQHLVVWGQSKKTTIDIVYGGNFVKDNIKYPGASLFLNDGKQVQINHQGVKIWCNLALHYQDKNLIKASGDVLLIQGDSIELRSDYMEYNGNNKLAIAKKRVELKTEKAILTTDSLKFDRNIQVALYESSGTIVSEDNVLTSNKGKYILRHKKFHFLDNVVIKNPDVIITSDILDYFTTTKNAYFYGATTFEGKEHIGYGENGFYDTKDKSGYMLKNARIHYKDRVIYGDSIFFDDQRDFASFNNNIKVIDTINNNLMRGHYAEVYQEKDSIVLSKRALAISLVENDSLYLHGDRMVLSGKEEERIMRVYNDVRLYKERMSGRCDSIFSYEKTGVTKMLRNPILWYQKSQIVGDTILMISDVKTEKLDSIKVIDNAFMIEKDTLGDGFNQTKSSNMLALFDDNKIDQIYTLKNSEVLYYMYGEEEEEELIGINKAVSNDIRIDFTEEKIHLITLLKNPKGTIFPIEDIPINARKLKGFDWQGENMITSIEGLFSPEDLSIVLPSIKGIDEKKANRIESILSKAIKNTSSKKNTTP